MDFVNAIKKGTDAYDIRDARIPATTAEDVGKVLALKEDGSFEFVESGPAPTPVIKGSVIKLGGEDYRVLSINEDLTDCEVMHIGPAKISKFRNSSPSQDPSAGVTFICSGVEKTGLKYDGSLLDQACEAFYDELPADIKAAIIEQEVVQDMYKGGVSEGTEDFAIDNSVDSEDGDVCRIKKMNDEPVAVGTRHAYVLSCGAFKKFYNTNTMRGVIVAKDFQLMGWFRDATFYNNAEAYMLSYASEGSTNLYAATYYDMYCVCPAFHIDLTKINL